MRILLTFLDVLPKRILLGVLEWDILVMVRVVQILIDFLAWIRFRREILDINFLVFDALPQLDEISLPVVLLLQVFLQDFWLHNAGASPQDFIVSQTIKRFDILGIFMNWL